MKATDLMIGDWVLMRGTPVQVRAIGVNTIRYSDMLITEPLENIEPIQLTPEILEKNFGEPVVDTEPNTQLADYRYTMGSLGDICNTGYITGYNIEDRSQTQGKICVCRENGAWMFYIRYVHELQHALRLCGIEKEITL